MTSRAVLVTGGSRGIGAAVATAFADRGDRVAVHYGRRSAQAEEVRDGLAGSGHVAVGADLADPEAVRRMVDDAAEALGGIDVLVNNAGIFEPHPIAETTYEEWQGAWRRTLDVNLTGAANVTWCALRHMPDGGRIVKCPHAARSGASPATRPTGRARRACVLRPVARPCPRPPRDLRDLGRAGVRRDRDGGGGAGRRGRRPPPRREPARPRRRRRRRSRPRSCTCLARGHDGQRVGARRQRRSFLRI